MFAMIPMTGLISDGVPVGPLADDSAADAPAASAAFAVLMAEAAQAVSTPANPVQLAEGPGPAVWAIRTALPDDGPQTLTQTEGDTAQENEGRAMQGFWTLPDEGPDAIARGDDPGTRPDPDPDQTAVSADHTDRWWPLAAEAAAPPPVDPLAPPEVAAPLPPDPVAAPPVQIPPGVPMAAQAGGFDLPSPESPPVRSRMTGDGTPEHGLEMRPLVRNAEWSAAALSPGGDTAMAEPVRMDVPSAGDAPKAPVVQPGGDKAKFSKAFVPPSAAGWVVAGQPDGENAAQAGVILSPLVAQTLPMDQARGATMDVPKARQAGDLALPQHADPEAAIQRPGPVQGATPGQVEFMVLAGAQQPSQNVTPRQMPSAPDARTAQTTFASDQVIGKDTPPAEGSEPIDPKQFVIQGQPVTQQRTPVGSAVAAAAASPIQTVAQGARAAAPDAAAAGDALAIPHPEDGVTTDQRLFATPTTLPSSATRVALSASMGAPGLPRSPASSGVPPDQPKASKRDAQPLELADPMTVRIMRIAPDAPGVARVGPEVAGPLDSAQVRPVWYDPMMAARADRGRAPQVATTRPPEAPVDVSEGQRVWPKAAGPVPLDGLGSPVARPTEIPAPRSGGERSDPLQAWGRSHGQADPRTGIVAPIPGPPDLGQPTVQPEPQAPLQPVASPDPVATRDPAVSLPWLAQPERFVSPTPLSNPPPPDKTDGPATPRMAESPPKSPKIQVNPLLAMPAIGQLAPMAVAALSSNPQGAVWSSPTVPQVAATAAIVGPLPGVMGAARPRAANPAAQVLSQTAIPDAAMGPERQAPASPMTWAQPVPDHDTGPRKPRSEEPTPPVQRDPAMPVAPPPARVSVTHPDRDQTQAPALAPLSPLTQTAPAPAQERAVDRTDLPQDLPRTLAKAAKEDRVELLLDPVELGKVRFELATTGDRVQVTLSVERPETLDLLRRHIETLKLEFRDAGFDAATLSFSGWGKGGDERQAAPAPTALMPEDRPAPPDREPAPRPYRPTSDQGLHLRL